MDVIGLRTEIAEEISLDARSISILLELENNGIVYFQTDDSNDDYVTIHHLKTICREAGYDLISKNSSCHFLIDIDNIPER